MRPNGIAPIALCGLLILAGCHKRKPTAASLPPIPAPPAAPATVAAPIVLPSPEPVADIPVPPPPPLPLEEANFAFASGNYDEAVKRYESYVRATANAAGPSAQREQALFQLGLAYALRSAPGPDWQHAIAAFKQLADEYPNSAWKGPANLIIGLRAQVDQATTDSRQREQRIRQLTTELDRLKKIDADRRKRP